MLFLLYIQRKYCFFFLANQKNTRETICQYQSYTTIFVIQEPIIKIISSENLLFLYVEPSHFHQPNYLFQNEQEQKMKITVWQVRVSKIS